MKILLQSPTNALILELAIRLTCQLKVKYIVYRVKATRLSVLIRKFFATRENRFLLKLYLTYVWSLHASVFSNRSRSVRYNRNTQRSFTRWFKLPHQMFNDKRLQHFNLISLRSKRIELDLETLFKIIRGIIYISPIRAGLLLPLEVKVNM